MQSTNVEIGIIEQHKTAVFGVRCSPRKKSVLLNSMRRAHKAFSKALDSCQGLGDELAAAEVSIAECDKQLTLVRADKSLSAAAKKRDVEALKAEKSDYRLQSKDLLKRIKKTASDTVLPLPVAGSTKAAIAVEIGAGYASYSKLLTSNSLSQPPTCRLLYPKNSDVESALDRLAGSHITEDEFRLAQDELARLSGEPGRPRPMGISRYRKGDGFMILVNSNGGLYALIPLMPSGNKRSKGAVIDGMVCKRTGEVVKGKTKHCELFPLVLSEHHEAEYFSRADIRTARVVYTENDTFELHVAFGFTAPRVAHQTVIGVDRGINVIAAFSVINGQTGEVVERRSFDGLEIRDYQDARIEAQRQRQRKGKVRQPVKWRGYNDHIVHVVSKQIVELARQHSAIVVWEQLNNISNGPHKKRKKGQRRAKGFNRLLSKAQYQKLQRVTRYKLACLGLDEPNKNAPEVHPAWTSQACPKCGCIDRENRKSQELFKCVSCGHEDNADDNAGQMIGIKWIYEEWRREQLFVKKAKAKDLDSFALWLPKFIAKQ